MKSFNNNEMDFQEKLQKDTEIPVIVHERINQAYRMIENDTVMQKKTPKDPYHWMKIGGRIAGGMAAVLAVGFIFYIQIRSWQKIFLLWVDFLKSYRTT